MLCPPIPLSSLCGRLELRFVQAADEYTLWKSVLLTLVAEHSGHEVAGDEMLVDEPLEVLKKGKLKMRPAKGGEVWDDFIFLLSPQSMTALDEVTGTQVIETFHINPSCSVFETNLGRNAFELVTPKRVLHVMAESREATSGWIKVLRETISKSALETNDPLLVAALDKMKLDVMYHVSFHEDKPLGVVLERSGEWAIVKLANERDTGVVVGSALMGVNNDNVMFAKYQETIGRLKNWRPPLTLSFLKSPEKRGFLVKESRGRHGNSRNWKRRFFVIEQGRIYYKDKDASDSDIKGDIPLMGSAVSLASSQETGKFFCFRLVSGVTCLVMQAETFDELMDWASTLYHAIGIANGGAHILRVEYERRTKEAAEIAAQSTPESAAARQEADVVAEQTVSEMVAKERARLHSQSPPPEEVQSPSPEAEEDVQPPAPPVAEEVADTPCPELQEEPAAAEIEAIPDDTAAIAEAAAAAVEVAAAEDAAREGEEQRAAAEAALKEATAAASLSDFSALMDALDAAQQAGVDQAVLSESGERLVALQTEQKEQAVLNEINKRLTDATSLKSVSALQSALKNAEIHNVDNENTAAATVLLAELAAAEEQRAMEEKARLEAEAAALDAELAAEEATALAAHTSQGRAVPMARLESTLSDEDDEDMDVSIM